MDDQVIGVLLIIGLILWVVLLVFFPLYTLAGTVAFLVWVVYSLLTGLARAFQR